MRVGLAGKSMSDAGRMLVRYMLDACHMGSHHGSPYRVRVRLVSDGIDGVSDGCPMYGIHGLSPGESPLLTSLLKVLLVVSAPGTIPGSPVCQVRVRLHPTECQTDVRPRPRKHTRQPSSFSDLLLFCCPFLQCQLNVR